MCAGSNGKIGAVQDSFALVARPVQGLIQLGQSVSQRQASGGVGFTGGDYAVNPLQVLRGGVQVFVGDAQNFHPALGGF